MGIFFDNSPLKSAWLSISLIIIGKHVNPSTFIIQDHTLSWNAKISLIKMLYSNYILYRTGQYKTVRFAQARKIRILRASTSIQPGSGFVCMTCHGVALTLRGRSTFSATWVMSTPQITTTTSIFSPCSSDHQSKLSSSSGLFHASSQ